VDTPKITGILHPVETAKGAGSAIRHPIRTGRVIKQKAKDSWKADKAYVG
jgi:hypothetical protein